VDKGLAENKKPYLRRVLVSLIKKPPGKREVLYYFFLADFLAAFLAAFLGAAFLDAFLAAFLGAAFFAAFLAMVFCF
jgi:hypothetical protein